MAGESVKSFQKTVLNYYRNHGRELPWRQAEAGKSHDPYKILVSEIMLQQTQVNRVIPKYHAFLQQFPDITSLAAAPLSAVLRVWNGLGYNRRAKYLHDAARRLAAKPQPWQTSDLTACTGIGYNTAAAVTVYAYNQALPFIETNIRSVYIHHFFAGQPAVSDKEILPLVALTIHQRRPREFYWALMDYGSHLKSSAGNPSRRSSHYAKQSPFRGSRRQLRGQVLKLLALSQPLSVAELRQYIPDQRLDIVLSALESERLIARRDAAYLLAS